MFLNACFPLEIIRLEHTLIRNAICGIVISPQYVKKRADTDIYDSTHVFVLMAFSKKFKEIDIVQSEW